MKFSPETKILTIFDLAKLGYWNFDTQRLCGNVIRKERLVEYEFLSYKTKIPLHTSFYFLPLEWTQTDPNTNLNLRNLLC